jgi:hypothetical protein
LSFLENIHVIAFRCSNDASLGRIRSNATANQMGLKLKFLIYPSKNLKGHLCAVNRVRVPVVTVQILIRNAIKLAINLYTNT